MAKLSRTMRLAAPVFAVFIISQLWVVFDIPTVGWKRNGPRFVLDKPTACSFTPAAVEEHFQQRRQATEGEAPNHTVNEEAKHPRGAPLSANSSSWHIEDHQLPWHIPQCALDSADPANNFQTMMWVFGNDKKAGRARTRKGRGITLRKIPPELAVDAGRLYTLWDRRRWRQKGGIARKGFHVKSGKDPSRIKRIWIWGERNSCTTLVTSLLRWNFANLSCGEKSCVIGGLPWKHAFMRSADLSHQESTLHLLVSRHPYEWLKSMHSHPFYAELHEDLAMADFLTLEWLSFQGKPQLRKPPTTLHRQPAERPRRETGMEGLHSREMRDDRDPDSFRRPPSIMALREGKIRDFFAATRDLDFSGHVACRDFLLDPIEVMEALQRKYKLERARERWELASCVLEFGVCKEKPSDWNDAAQRQTRMHYLGGRHMHAFDQATLDIANAWADPVLEAHLGYALFGDVDRASTPYNNRTRCEVHAPRMWASQYCPAGSGWRWRAAG